MRATSPRAFRGLIWLLAIEAIPALILLFRTPSEAVDAVLLGFTLPRLLLGAAFALFLAALFGMAWGVSTERTWAQWVQLTWLSLFFSRARIQRTLLILFYAAALTTLFTSLLLSPAARHFGPLEFVADRSASILIWTALAYLQTLALVLAQTHPIWLERGFLFNYTTLRYGLTATLCALTGLHWIMILLRLPWFTDLPHWWMRFVSKPFTYRDALFVLILLSALGLIKFVFTRPYRVMIILLALTLFSYSTQWGFGAIDGGGFQSLRLKLVQSNHNRFALNSVPDLSILKAIRLYDERHRDDQILCTKPPGSLVFYIATEKAANAGKPTLNIEERYANLTQFAARVFPLYAALLVPALYFLSRRFLNGAWAYLPSLLLFVTPSFLLIQLQLDQFLYPVLFILGVLLFYLSYRKRDRAIAFLAGVYTYLALFITFSLIPLLGLAAAMAALAFCFDRSNGALKQWYSVVLLMLVGFLLCHILFSFALDYNFTARYLQAIDCHRRMKLYDPGFRQVIDGAILNNLEFTLWVGFPLIGLGLVRMAIACVHLLRRNLARLDWIALPFAAMLIGLNAVGQTRGEVGRIWIFLVPVFALLAVDTLRLASVEKPKAISIIFLIQLLTSYLVFKYMDFF